MIPAELWMLMIGACIVAALIGFGVLAFASMSKTVSNPEFGIEEPSDADHDESTDG